MKRKLALLLSLLVLVTAVVSGPALAKKSGNKEREVTLYDYAGAIRWSEFDKAASFLDAAWLIDHPLTQLEMHRYKQVQVTGYDVKAKNTNPDGTYEQIVEIHLINIHTQVERAIIDHQIWRWDLPNKHWWLTSGLPDITAAEDEQEQ